jgi:succinate dehydrogenase/fumarate reductase flavoprotein subunit
VSGCDVIVVGSGAGGLAAACTAAASGLSVLLLEQSSCIGGTTAISGGMIWAPANPFLPTDSIEAARLYLDDIAPAEGRDAVREAFLAEAGEAIRFFCERTAVKLRPVARYPDYYPDRPGATAGARVLEPEPFDGRELGEAFSWLRPPLPEFTLFGGMMVSRADIPHFRAVFESFRSALRVARLVAGYGLQRLRHPRGTTLYLGNALVARLLKSALDAGVVVRRNVTVQALVRSDDGVGGVVLRDAAGREERVTAGRAVVLATGGLGQDPEWRERLFPRAAQGQSAAVPVGSAPVGARLAAPFGARVTGGNVNPAFWVPVSVFERPDGTKARFPHTVTDRGKPGLIAVNRNGSRFVNEALSYHEFVLAMFAAGEAALPTWLVCDSRFLRKYGLGAVRPMSLSVRRELASGYLRSGATLSELARSIGVPPENLKMTVERFNADARRGEDTEFGKGGDIYQRHLGDSEVGPNPCLAPLETPPFYAIAVHPAELGAAAGLAVDARARLLGPNDEPIPGLYACGNDMHSVMLGSYPGPGITLGPALTFGYIVGKEIADR